MSSGSHSAYGTAKKNGTFTTVAMACLRMRIPYAKPKTNQAQANTILSVTCVILNAERPVADCLQQDRAQHVCLKRAEYL